MRPVYVIKADGSDITGLIRGRLISLTITDETGLESDRAVIELDDRGNPFVLPGKGVHLDISAGFEMAGRTVINNMGAFVVDEVGISGPPDKLIIEAKAANMTAKIKEKKTRAWDNVTLSDIVSTIARSHGLTPVVGTDLADILFEHLDQTEESDLHFLTRLGLEHDAVAKPVARRLLMTKKGQAKAASGKSLPTVALVRTDFVSPGWDMKAPDRGKYSAVTAYYQDAGTGDKIPVTVGSGSPAYPIRAPFESQAMAYQAAQSKLTRLNRGTATLSGHVYGRADLFAEGRIQVSGVREGVNGLWGLTRVSTRISDQGYTVDFDAEVPNG